MDNGGVNTYDIGTLAGLRGISYPGYGYGGNGNFLGDGSAVKASVRSNTDLNLLESVNNGTRSQFLSNQIDRGNTTVIDNINMGNRFLSEQFREQGMEFRFAALERLINANDQRQTAAQHALDLKVTECCCELKAGQATIIANQEAARLADAQAENQNLRTQIMITQNQGQAQGN